MRTLTLAAAVLAAVTLVAGCIESDQDVTVNPDGSGKARVELVMSDMPFSMTPQNEPPDPQAAARRFAKSVLDNSKGVETWADVSVDRTEDNRSRFVGTAYFKDYEQMQLQAGKMEGVTLEQADEGGMLLRIEPEQQTRSMPGAPAASPATPPKPEEKPSEEQVQQHLAAERAAWQQMKPMMAMTIGKMKMQATFHLPGKLVEVKGFEKTPDGGVRFAFDGGRLIEIVDKLMADDAYVRETMRADRGGKGQPLLGEEALKQLFGTSGPLVARTAGPAEAQFDFAAEVQAAKAAYPAMIKKLGLDKVAEPEAKAFGQGPDIDALEPDSPTVPVASADWAWEARIESKPSGAKVYAIEGPNEKRFLGTTPLTTTVMTIRFEGAKDRGQTQVQTDFHQTVSMGKGGYSARFEVVQGGKTQMLVGRCKGPAAPKKGDKHVSTLEATFQAEQPKPEAP